MKENKGITLVALIITIIVMMILVAVSVAVILRSDLLGTAQNAGRSYKEKADAEGNLSKGDVTINNQTWDEYMQSMCSHTYGEWETTKEASYSEAGEKERTCTKCGKVEKETIAKLVCTEHTFANNECTICGIRKVSFNVTGQAVDDLELGPFYAFEGMKWGEWVASDFNINGFWIGEETGCVHLTQGNARLWIVDSETESPNKDDVIDPNEMYGLV